MTESHRNEAAQIAASPAIRRPWLKPELRKLDAGSAETSGAVSDDGVVGNS